MRTAMVERTSIAKSKSMHTVLYLDIVSYRGASGCLVRFRFRFSVSLYTGLFLVVVRNFSLYICDTESGQLLLCISHFILLPWFKMDVIADVQQSLNHKLLSSPASTACLSEQTGHAISTPTPPPPFKTFLSIEKKGRKGPQTQFSIDSIPDTWKQSPQARQTPSCQR